MVSLTPTLLPAIALAGLAACGHVRFESERESRTFRESIDRGNAKEATAEIHMGAGELRLGGGAGAKLIEAEMRTSGDRPRFAFNAGSRARIRVGQGSRFRGNRENDWDFRLSEEVPLDLEVHLGAGRAQLDLADLKPRRIEVHMGAGQLELDLRGNYDSDVEVEIHGGVGEAKLRLPRKMRIDADVRGGLGEIDARGLDRDNGRYVSRGNIAGPKMTMEIHGGVGRIELDAE